MYDPIAPPTILRYRSETIENIVLATRYETIENIVLATRYETIESERTA